MSKALSRKTNLPSYYGLYKIAVFEEDFEQAKENLEKSVPLRLVEFSEDEAKKVLSEDEIFIDINLFEGDKEATAWGCDLTYDYVKINGDYRT